MARVDRDKWWKMGKPMPVAAAFGIDPLLFLVGATSFPKTESEYDFYGGLAGEPMEVFRSESPDCRSPPAPRSSWKDSSHPGETFPEGPFGEFTGYYAREGDNPYVRIEKIRFRENPTLTCALANEPALLLVVDPGVVIRSDLDRIGVPGIKGVWCIPEAGGRGHNRRILGRCMRVTPHRR